MRKCPPFSNSAKPAKAHNPTKPLDRVPALCGVRVPLSLRSRGKTSVLLSIIIMSLGTHKNLSFPLLSPEWPADSASERLFRPFLASSKLTLCYHVKGKPSGALENGDAIQGTLGSKGNPCPGGWSGFLKSHPASVPGRGSKGWLVVPPGLVVKNDCLQGAL